jgi:hypothetical protein
VDLDARRAQAQALERARETSRPTCQGLNSREEERLDALGHPLAASGTRVILNVLSEMHRKKDIKYGMAAACAAGGMGCSMVFGRYEG